jgi:predicted  nucleic acid-binding Zn-ribbon protein
MEDLDQSIQQLESDPEIRAIKERLARLEAQIKAVVSEEAWHILLEWEETWAHYVTLCIGRLHPSSRPDAH